MGISSFSTKGYNCDFGSAEETRGEVESADSASDVERAVVFSVMSKGIVYAVSREKDRAVEWGADLSSVGVA